MRYLSMFSGIEAASVAWKPLGWEATAVCEIDPFASALLAHHYPDVPNLGNVEKADFDAIGPVDLVVGGSPCFPAGVLITTTTGLKPIETVGVGDMVLTHRGRWRRVLRAGGQIADTIVVKGQGHPGLVTTPDHPFYACKKRGQSTRVDGRAVRHTWIEGPDWIAAKDLAGHHWASIVEFPETTVPVEVPVGREEPMPEISVDLMWLAGAYLGDGWTRQNDRRGSVVFGVNERKADAIMERVDRLALAATITEERTTTRVVLPRRCFARWLSRHFGSGATGKRLPVWALGMNHDLRRALLDGYVAMDGTPVASCRGWRCSSVSWPLVLGVKMLANSLGHASSVSRVENGRDTCVIEGRTVNERPYWTVTVSNSDRTSFEAGIHRFGCVRSVAPTGRSERVFNIEVDEDNSYVADGIVVHNCQSFSVAGKRLGLDDARGNLALVGGQVVYRKRPRWFVFENVPGILSSDSGWDFGTLLAAFAGYPPGSVFEPPADGWRNSGTVAEAEGGYGLAWRVLDAQFVRVDGFGRAVPQRRRRVFLVGHSGDWRRAAAVLFERASLCGNPPPRRQAGKATAPTLAARTRGGGGLGTDAECDGALIPDVSKALTVARGRASSNADDLETYLPVARCVTAGHGQRIDFETETFVAHALRADGFDASEDGTGRGTPLVPVQAMPLLEIGKGSSSRGAGPNGAGFGEIGDPMFTPQAGAQHGVAVCFDETQITSKENRCNPQPGDPCHPLARGARPPTLAFSVKDYGNDVQTDIAPTMRAMGHDGSHANAGGQLGIAFNARQDPDVFDGHTGPLDTDGSTQGILSSWRVRRLVPEECEALQGFPRGYSAIPYRGKPAADGPRYKALGNSMAVNVMRWIGRRIEMVEQKETSRAAAQAPRAPGASAP